MSDRKPAQRINVGRVGNWRGVSERLRSSSFSFDRLERHPVYSRGSVILLRKLIGFPERRRSAEMTQ